MRRRVRWVVIVMVLIGLVPLRDRLWRDAAPYRAELLEAGDVLVRVVRTGTGDTTFLLLHGYGESLMAWKGMVGPLARHGRVVALDIPGFGASDKPAGPYTLAAQVERLGDLVDRKISGPVIVVGHSMGGEIAVGLALSRPERVVGLILIASAGIQIGTSGAMDSVGNATTGLISWFNSVRTVVLPIHDPSWLDEPQDLAEYDVTTDPAYRASSVAVLDSFDFRGLRGRLGDLRQPTLLIWGENDPLIPLAVGRIMAREIPCATLVIVEDAFHRPQVERPEKVTRAVEAFLTHPTCPPAP